MIAALGPILTFFRLNWKEILIAIGIAWPLFCFKFHCGNSDRPTSDTISVQVDTVWVYPDTNAIFVLNGFDTLPRYVRKLEARRWKAVRPTLADASDCKDSLNEYQVALTWCDALLEECDSTFREATAIRGYSDTLRNDSIELTVSLEVSGKLNDRPTIAYRYLLPMPVITKTVTLAAPVHRKAYLEAGAGVGGLYTREIRPFPQLSLGLGYMDRRNRSYGATGQFSQNYWSASFEMRFFFDL